MSYFHCQIINGVSHVRHTISTVETPAAYIDFVSGDFTPGSMPDGQRALLPGNTVGTDLTTALVATGAVWVVTDTTGMSNSDKIGAELDSGHWFYTRVSNVDSGTQITVDRGVPSGAAIGNRIAVVGQLDGSTDFTLIQDFKTVKVSNILNKTKRLSIRGVDHGGTRFGIIAEDTRLDLLALAALIDTDADDGGDAKGTYDIPNKDNENFDFPSAANFETFRSALLARYKEIYQGAGGQGDLIYDVIDADNTQVAMDAIVDGRS